MAEKTRHKVYVDSLVIKNTVDIKDIAVIQAGKRVDLITFGGTDPYNLSITAIQWGSGSSWETIRVGSGCFEFKINASYIGDGSKYFRIIRQNLDASMDKKIYVWAEALVHDAKE